MNNRLKALTVTLLIIILLTNFVSAVQVTDITQGLQNNNEQIAKINAELNAKMEQVNQKLDSFATKDDVTNLLSLHLQKTNEIMDWFRSILIVSFIVIGLSLLGLGYSIYFYFKSRGRL